MSINSDAFHANFQNAKTEINWLPLQMLRITLYHFFFFHPNQNEWNIKTCIILPIHRAFWQLCIYSTTKVAKYFHQNNDYSITSHAFTLLQWNIRVAIEFFRCQITEMAVISWMISTKSPMRNHSNSMQINPNL